MHQAGAHHVPAVTSEDVEERDASAPHTALFVQNGLDEIVIQCRFKIFLTSAGFVRDHLAY